VYIVPVMPDEISKRHFQQEALRRINKQVVEELYDTATQLSVQSVDADAIINGLHEFEKEGFKHTDNDGNVLITGFASPDPYYRLQNGPWNYHGSDTEIDTVKVYDISIHISPMLPDESILLVHDSAITPNLTVSKTPFSVRHPKGVVVLTPLE